MPSISPEGLAVALGAGLLIGIERERRKRQRREPAFAGLRTFAIAALAGGLSYGLGGAWALSATILVTGLLAALSAGTYPSRDPGVTTEVALVLAVLLGALAMDRPSTGAGLGVIVAILLAARGPLHRFAAVALTSREVRDALIIAAASFVVLPLLPDRGFGPFGAFNPHKVWVVVILVLIIGGLGHVATRLLGVRLGLPIAGLVSGFVSSTATIGAMGARAKASPALLPTAAAAAVLSTVATIAEMAAVVGATSAATLKWLAAPLAATGLAAIAYGAAFTWRAVRQPVSADSTAGEALQLRDAALFAALLSVVLVVSAALRAEFGEAGVLVGAALAGLVDAHAAAIAVANLAATGQLAPQDAVAPILVGLTTNTASKLAVALAVGGRAFAARVGPGLLIVVSTAWLAAVAASAMSWAR